jgi:hypothetical protein
MNPRTIAIISATAIAAPLLLTAAARAGGEPGYYPPQQLPPVIVPTPPVYGTPPILAIPFGIVALPFQALGWLFAPVPVAVAAPQVAPMPRYEKDPGWRAPEGHGGCYGAHGEFLQPPLPECR